MELNKEEIVKDLQRLVDKYGENGSYNTYCTLSDSLTLIKELTDERDRCLEALSELTDNIGLLKDKARADAVRKFAEYLKEHSFTCDPDNWLSFDAIDVDELDDYVKRFLEEDE